MAVSRASIYKFPDSFVICPVCKTTTGIEVTTEPYETVPANISSLALGEAVFRALGASREDIAHPLDWKALAAPGLAAAKVKSETAFQKKAELVSVHLNEAVFVVTPYRNGGTAGAEKGFHQIENSEARLTEYGPETIGNTVFECFKQYAG